MCGKIIRAKAAEAGASRPAVFPPFTLPQLVNACLSLTSILLAIGRRYFRDHDLAWDLVQEVRRKVIEHPAPRVITQADAKSWICTVAKNTASHWVRKFKPTYFPTEAFSEIAETPCRPMGLSEATQRAVQSLPHEEKEIIVLRFVHGCSFSEIARIIHLPAVSVTRLAYKALQRMREALESWEKVA